MTAKTFKVHPKDPEAAPGGVDDMTKLAYLHEPGVLQNLRSRYDMNEIYVSSLEQTKLIMFSFILSVINLLYIKMKLLVIFDLCIDF